MANITVVPYDPSWPLLFASIKADLVRDLENVPVKSIEHVGSTSVPGLWAKPIIDIDVIVDRADVPAAIEALTRSGFYKNMGEWGIPGRHALRATDPSTKPVRNLYVCVDGVASLRNMLGVRDVLRKDDGLREEYGRVKRELAARVESMEEYTEGKCEILQKILRVAGTLSEEEMKEVFKLNNRPEKGGVMGEALDKSAPRAPGTSTTQA